MIKVFASAKINLSLLVGKPFESGKYKDYHSLNSLVAFSSNIGDEITLSPAQKFQLTIDGEFGASLANDKSNLVVRAALLMAEKFERELDFSINLRKNLPIAAGIGGGSSNAAATIIAIDKYWNLGLEKSQMCEIGGNIGADVPVCILGENAIMQSIGDVFAKAPKIPKNIPILLANPLLECSTPAVFKAFDTIGDFANIEKLEYQDCESLDELVTMLKKMPNSLTKPATQMIDEIAILIQSIEGLEGAKFVAMSGSGASVFALFDTIESANAAASLLQRKFVPKPIWAKAGNIA